MGMESGVRRHRPVHGVSIGIVVLDTSFRRLPGDVGNASTFVYPVQYAIARGVTPQKIVRAEPENLLGPFLSAVDELVALGVDGITTTCGFAALYHRELVEHSPVPVASSSLLQVPFVQAMLPAGRKVGILTSNADALTDRHLEAVGCPSGLPTEGLLPGSIIHANNRSNAATIDQAAQEAEVVEAAIRLVASDPAIGAIVMECANFPPYAARVFEAAGLPVYDTVSMIDWFHAGLKPRRYSGAD